MSWYVRRPLSREQSISPSFTHYRRLQEIRAAIPSHLFIRETRRGLAWLALDIAMAGCCWRIASFIDPTFTSHAAIQILSSPGATFACWTSWMLYWWFQGLIFTGIWVIGHECGHGAFSPNQRLCNVIGFITHSLLWTPYLSWKISHHRHHCNHASMERDEVYVPKTRSELGIPEDDGLTKIDYEEYFGDTPIYTLFMLVRQQLLAFPAYLLFNVSGQKTYPRWTNHFDPNSVLFTKEQRNAVLLSNFGIIAVAALVRQACKTWGVGTVIKYYGVPWLCVTHWFIMITYLHHTDPELPHYRQAEWNFQRGGPPPVVNRNWGATDHGAEATKHLRAFLGEHYHYSEKPVFKALWDNYNDCQFVEDRGDVLFYRDRKGRAVIRPAARYQICAAESSS
ncbi:linoleoyl phosphatidylcholine delta-12 acetylenase [Trametes gibbosa]|nr:linoleoyl phosphatidylcholine delta-12 acetylenase [Trametes gibbosa]